MVAIVFWMDSKKTRMMDFKQSGWLRDGCDHVLFKIQAFCLVTSQVEWHYYVFFFLSPVVGRRMLKN